MRRRFLMIVATLVFCAIVTPGAETAPARAGQLQERILKRFDRDGDGQLDREERQAARKALQEQRGQAQAQSRPAAQQAPEGVRVLRDLEYAKVNGKSLRLDAFLPAGAAKPLPVIVWIHGGGWRAGSKERCPAIPLSGAGYAVFSIDYRLTDVAAFPAQIHDCKGAIRWIRAHAREYNLDPKRIGVWGSSAGGHLVALLGTSGDVKELEGEVGGNLDQSSRVQAVCDFCGPTLLTGAALTPGDPRASQDGPEAVRKLLGGPLSENRDKARLASPVQHVTKDDPPFLIVHGAKDPLVPVRQAELLHEALKKAEVAVTYRLDPNAGHGLGSPENIRLAKQFFDAQLRASQNEPGAPAH